MVIMHEWSSKAHVMIMLILLISFANPINATSSMKLDKKLAPQVQKINTEIKCGTCPCVNPCAQQPPPPPPPLPPPPPKGTYCTPLPPPPPRFIYVTGVPGELYHADADEWGFYSSAERNVVMGLLIFFGYGVWGLLENW